MVSHTWTDPSSMLKIIQPTKEWTAQVLSLKSLQVTCPTTMFFTDTEWPRHISTLTNELWSKAKRQSALLTRLDYVCSQDLVPHKLYMYHQSLPLKKKKTKEKSSVFGFLPPAFWTQLHNSWLTKSQTEKMKMYTIQHYTGKYQKYIFNTKEWGGIETAGEM